MKNVHSREEIIGRNYFDTNVGFIFTFLFWFGNCSFLLGQFMSGRFMKKMTKISRHCHYKVCLKYDCNRCAGCFGNYYQNTDNHPQPLHPASASTPSLSLYTRPHPRQPSSAPTPSLCLQFSLILDNHPQPLHPVLASTSGFILDNHP